jgi:hypothetical protein
MSVRHRRAGTGRRRGCALAGVLLIVAGLAGCQSGGAVRMPEPVQHPMLDGIPLPRGFAPVNDRTMAFESGRFRLARYEFVGGVPRNTVLEFFVNALPSAGFRLGPRQDERGVYIVRFMSEREELSIQIGSRGLNKTYFVLNVGPLPQAPARDGNDTLPQRGPAPR